LNTHLSLSQFKQPGNNTEGRKEKEKKIQIDKGKE
jgi:hypothetical protein